MIIVFVTIPAGLARVLGIGMAWLAGVFWFTGYETLFMGIPVSLAFLGWLVVSVIFYLVLVGVDYVLAKHRDTVSRITVARCVTAELSVQILGILGGSMVIAALSNDRARAPLLTFGLPLVLAALTISFAYNRRVEEWRAAWNGEGSIVAPPANAGEPRN
jgi:hypothetical protein